MSRPGQGPTVETDDIEVFDSGCRLSSVAHFMVMLKETKQRITAEELQAVEAILKKNAEQILGRRQRR